MLGVQIFEKVSVNGYSIKYSVIIGSRVFRGVQIVQIVESIVKIFKLIEIVFKEENIVKILKLIENVVKIESIIKIFKLIDRQQYSEKGFERKEESIDIEKLIDLKFVLYDKYLFFICVDNLFVKLKFKYLMYLEQYFNGGVLVFYVY